METGSPLQKTVSSFPGPHTCVLSGANSAGKQIPGRQAHVEKPYLVCVGIVPCWVDDLAVICAW